MFSRVLVIAAASFLITSCGGSITGQVFIDSNGDGAYDSEEMGIPYAKVSVTRDGEKIAEHYTDTDGNFDIAVKPRPGEICVSVDLSFAESNLDYILYSANQESTGAAMAVSPPKASKVKATTTGDDGDTDDTDDDADDSDSGSTVDTSEPTTSAPGWVGLKYCGEKLKEAFIPVKMDYEGAIGELPTRLAVKCYAGSTCDITIPYPKGCQLHTIYLPEGLTPADTGDGVSYSASMNSVSFGENVGELGSTAFKASTTGHALAVSDYYIMTLKLDVADDIPVGQTDTKLEPSAKCDDQVLELQPIPIELLREFNIRLYWQMSSPPYESEKPVQMVGGIWNDGKSTISFGDLYIVAPEGSVLTSVPAGCTINDNYTTCRIEKIQGNGGGDTRSISLKLPKLDASILSGESKSYPIDVKFQAPGMEESITLEDMEPMKEEDMRKVIIFQP